jgi:hypothetical protein
MLGLLDIHAGAIQALCATVALLIGAIGTVLILKSLKAARLQAEASSNQFDIIQRQYSESLRPVIVVSVERSTDDCLLLKLTNDGAGPALEMDGPFTKTTNILGSKSSCSVATMHGDDLDYDSLSIRYVSLDGRRFETVVTIYSKANCLHSYRELKKGQ